MALETASYISNLVTTNPDGGDARSTADDHLRLIKAVLKRSFPNIDSAVSLSAAQMMFCNDLSASVQTQLNQLRDGSATANAAINSRYANSASYAVLAGTATLALTANSASYAAHAGTATLALTATTASSATNASHASSASFATVASHASSASFATVASHASSASFATVAATATTATTATTASNADALGGFSASQADTGSTVAVRNSSGDLFVRYVNSSASPSSSLSVGHLFVMTASDGYQRPCAISRAGEYMEARNISGRSGTAKNLASGSGPPSLSGSTNGDFFYYY